MKVISEPHRLDLTITINTDSKQAAFPQTYLFRPSENRSLVPPRFLLSCFSEHSL